MCLRDGSLPAAAPDGGAAAARAPSAAPASAAAGDEAVIRETPTGRLWTPEMDDMVRRAYSGDGAGDEPEAWTPERCGRALGKSHNALRLRWKTGLAGTAYVTPSRGRFVGKVRAPALCGGRGGGRRPGGRARHAMRTARRALPAALWRARRLLGLLLASSACLVARVCTASSPSHG